MTKTIVGHFSRANAAEKALERLESAGFQPQDVSYVAHDGTGAFADLSRGQTESGHGVAKGATAGGVSGLLLGLAALAVPGVGPVVAAGPIAAAIAGAGIGAATGGLLGALSSMGVPDAEGRYWSDALSHGGALVIVRANEEIDDVAVRELEAAGAGEVRQHAEEVGATGIDPADPHASPENYGDEGGSSQWSQTVLRVREGESEVAKRTFSRFGKSPERLD